MRTRILAFAAVALLAFGGVAHGQEVDGATGLWLKEKGKLAYAPTPVTGGASSGAAAGSLKSNLTTPAFSVLSGNAAVNSSTGALTTTATAPSSGTIAAHVRVQDATNANAVEMSLLIPIASAPSPSGGAFQFNSAANSAFIFIR